MNNQNNNSLEQKPKNNGGLYSKVNVSVRTVNMVIIAGIAALVFCVIFMTMHGGFTVDFDTDGGSHVESQKLKYGDKVEVSDNPVKEGYSFEGWYVDRACTDEWDMENDTVQESMTLFAGWEEK